MRTTRNMFNDHKRTAAQRGIAFELTYAQWLRIWGDKISQRGQRMDQYCMSRKGDRGGYTVGNVRVITNAQNIAERDSARGEANGNAVLTC